MNKIYTLNSTLTFDSGLHLQIRGTAMGTISVPTYANVIMGYHETKVYSIILQSYDLASKHFENIRFRFLDNCQLLLKVNLIKPDHLISILSQINDNIQFTMEKSHSRLPFLDIIIKVIQSLDGYLQQANTLKTKL